MGVGGCAESEPIDSPEIEEMEEISRAIDVTDGVLRHTAESCGTNVAAVAAAPSVEERG